MANRHRYAILEHLLTSPSGSGGASNSSFSEPQSHTISVSCRSSSKAGSNNNKPVIARYASFSSLIDLNSEPLPKLSPREVDDVLGPNNAGLNVSLESIPALFTPNNQCSDMPPNGTCHAQGHHPTIHSLTHASSSHPPAPPKRACSAPAAHLSPPFLPAASHEAPAFTTLDAAASGWRLGSVVKVIIAGSVGRPGNDSSGSSGGSIRRPVIKSLITTSADILKSFEPVSDSETTIRRSAPSSTSGRPVGVAVARSGSVQDVTTELAEEFRKRSILRLFPSLQQQQQQQPRFLLATTSTKPRPMAVVTPGRSGIHVDPLLCRVPGCDKLFRNAAARNQHYTEAHASETFPCPRCPIRLTTKTSLDFHRRKKHQDFVRLSRECPVEGCVRKFYVDSRLVHHLRVHHRQRCLPCLHPDCDAKFLTSRERERHLRNDHPTTPPSSSALAGPPASSASALARHTVPCPDCSRHFSTRVLLSRHRRRVHRAPKPSPAAPPLVDCATNTGLSSASSSPGASGTTAPAAVPPCAICEAEFSSWEQLSAHLAAHARLATDMMEQRRRHLPGGTANPVSRPATAEVGVGTEAAEGAARRPPPRVAPAPGPGPVETASPAAAVLLACPFGECVTLCQDHRAFREHFATHFSGTELPAEQVAALPPPDYYPAVEAALPSLPFESSMEDTNCLTSFNDAETSSLFQALDLNLLSAITEEANDSDLLDQMLAPDLASALTLPDAVDPRSKLPTVKRPAGSGPAFPPALGNTASVDFAPFGGCYSTAVSSSAAAPTPTTIGGPPVTVTEMTASCGGGVVSSASMAPSILSEEGCSCARTCPRLNQQMVDLAKRRRALLLERVTLGFEPRHPGGSSAHLKDVMRQIFHSKALPSKYLAPTGGEDAGEQTVTVVADTPAVETAESEALLNPLTDWMLPSDMLTQGAADTPIDPPMLDQLL